MRANGQETHKYIAVQMGARRNYGVPYLLHRADMLSAFYTDICADAGFGRFLDALLPSFSRRGAVARLLGRRLPAELRPLTSTFAGPTLRYLARQKTSGGDEARGHDVLSDFSRELGRAMIGRGVGGATHVYAMLTEALGFVEFAKGRGLKIVSEIFIAPQTHEIVQAERRAFPELEPPISDEIIERDRRTLAKLCGLIDAFVVPSEFVAQGLAEGYGVAPSACHLVPYGVDESWLAVRNRPAKGRVLMVGWADLRKGVHYLGMAAERLRARGYEFQVAGGVSDAVRRHRLTRDLIFLGRVPRAQVKALYEKADVFVLPSLAEGSAEVVYEALAAGVPVVTTKAAGSVVRDGVEGFIVPERDPEALAARVEQLVEDRPLRESTAAAAKERGKDYTWEAYGRRLLNVLREV